jgi:hypothetical protein
MSEWRADETVRAQKFLSTWAETVLEPYIEMPQSVAFHPIPADV